MAIVSKDRQRRLRALGDRGAKISHSPAAQLYIATYKDQRREFAFADYADGYIGAVYAAIAWLESVVTG